jgi:hypothetical protein
MRISPSTVDKRSDDARRMVRHEMISTLFLDDLPQFILDYENEYGYAESLLQVEAL